MKIRLPLANIHLLRIAAAVAVLACSFSTGCKSPWGWWGGGSGGSMYGSATPDVGKQKYDGLSQDFSGGAAGAYKSPTASNGNYLTSAWNKSTAAVGSAFSWKSKPENEDPTSLDTKTKPIGPDVFIAAGQMYETQGKYNEALGQYEKALKAAPNDLPAIISIARLHDRQGNFPKAIEAYNRAVASHPKTGLVYNDLGLCYARHKDNNKAIASLTQACALAPKTAKYRNNLATVLVENGQTEEAYKQLKALNTEGVAHYNLAIMLTARGKQAEAANHLQLALNAEPELQAARELLAQVSGQPLQGAQQGPYAQVAAQPPMTQQQAVSLFQAGPPTRTTPFAQQQSPASSPFQTASQSSNNPVEIVFPTGPANGQPAVQSPAATQVTIPQGPEETSFRIGDEEGPQLLPPVTE